MNVIAANKTEVVISVWPWGKYLGDHSVSVKISKTRRIAPQTADMNAKVC
jgi:branched-subunit amino acid aminotransferase/4-amino-4-deoxychorismate lyase